MAFQISPRFLKWVLDSTSCITILKNTLGAYKIGYL